MDKIPSGLDDQPEHQCSVSKSILPFVTLVEFWPRETSESLFWHFFV